MYLTMALMQPTVHMKALIERSGSSLIIDRFLKFLNPAD